MILEEEIATIAQLMGDKTRAAILVALLEGKALTAGELAIRANISPQTASNHLKKLLDAQLIVSVATPTRYRYYKIASCQVAKALESLSLLTVIDKKRPPRHDKLDPEICFARTCYDHLAGKLGVKLAAGLQHQGYLQLKDEEFILTNAGKLFFIKLGIRCDELMRSRRQFTKPCLDWTEREYHLAGSLGQALLEYLLTNRLLVRSNHKARVLVLTAKGKQWLSEQLAIEST